MMNDRIKMIAPTHMPICRLQPPREAAGFISHRQTGENLKSINPQIEDSINTEK